MEHYDQELKTNIYLRCMFVLKAACYVPKLYWTDRKQICNFYGKTIFASLAITLTVSNRYVFVL